MDFQFKGKERKKKILQKHIDIVKFQCKGVKKNIRIKRKKIFQENILKAVEFQCKGKES